MFYSCAQPSKALDKAIDSAAGSQIDVQAISREIMITFRYPLWTQLMEGRLLVMDMVIYNMAKLNEASGLPVVAVLPGNFILCMDYAKSLDYKKNSYKFTAAATDAMMALVTCNFVSCDPRFFI